MHEAPVASLAAGGKYVRFLVHIPANGPPPDGYVDATIEVHSGTFSGGFRTTLWPGDLDHVRSVIADVHAHVGETDERSFSLFEGEVAMTFHPTRLGTIETEVEVSPDHGVASLLRFTMSLDQSYLPAWIQSLDTAIELLRSARHDQ